MNISMNTIKKVPRKYIYFFGSFGGILFGYDIGVMTGALPFLQLDWHMHSAFWEGCWMHCLGEVLHNFRKGLLYTGVCHCMW